MKRPVCAVIALLCGCASPPPPQGRLVFVRDGVIAPDGSEGRGVGGGRRLVETPWAPGASVTVGARTERAPARPECAPIFSVDLGDVRGLVARGGEDPNTALAFSPDGSAVAVGTHLGEVLVVDGFTGAVRVRRRLAETMVKRVAWAPNGRTLYAAEASPDAAVQALDPATLATRWAVRLADEVQSSPPPPATDIYGVYTLPAAYALEVLPDGDLIVAGVHAWPGPDGAQRNLSRLLRLRPDGSRVAAWPAEGPADAVLRHVVVDRPGGLLAVPLGRSAAGDPPPDLPIGATLVLDLATLTVRGTIRTEPLAPHFERARIWEGLDVDGATGVALLGFSDGRIRLTDLEGTDRAVMAVGTPILSGDVPIVAGVSWARLVPGGALAITSDTNIPWGSQTTATRPPAAHPAERTVWAWNRSGAPSWTWSGDHVLQGITLRPDGRRAIIGAGTRSTDTRRDLFGALVFRLDGQGTGNDRLEVVCPTEGPVFFRHAATDDGRIAVSEVPFRDDDGDVLGAYRLTVLR